MNPADMTREELIIEVTRVRNLIADFVKIWDETIPPFQHKKNVIFSAK